MTPLQPMSEEDRAQCDDLLRTGTRRNGVPLDETVQRIARHGLSAYPGLDPDDVFDAAMDGVMDQVQKRGVPDNPENWLAHVAHVQTGAALIDEEKRRKSLKKRGIVETSLNPERSREGNHTRGLDRESGHAEPIELAEGYDCPKWPSLPKSTYSDRNHYYLKRIVEIELPPSRVEQETGRCPTDPLAGLWHYFELRPWDDTLTFNELRAGARFHGDNRTIAADDFSSWLNGETREEIAERRGVNEGTVSTGINRTLQKLRKSPSIKKLATNFQPKRPLPECEVLKMNIPDDKALLCRDVARILRTSRQRVGQLAKSGELRCVQFGNKFLFDPAEVQRFIREGSATKKAA